MAAEHEIEELQLQLESKVCGLGKAFASGDEKIRTVGALKENS